MKEEREKKPGWRMVKTNEKMKKEGMKKKVVAGIGDTISKEKKEE